jgi:S-adenosylhomocysteine hydrolase
VLFELEKMLLEKAQITKNKSKVLPEKINDKVAKMEWLHKELGVVITKLEEACLKTKKK